MEDRAIAVLALGIWALAGWVYGWRRGLWTFKGLPPRWGEKGHPLTFLLFIEGVAIYLFVQLVVGLWGFFQPDMLGWAALCGGVAGLGALLVFLNFMREGLVRAIWGRGLPLLAGVAMWLFAFPSSGFVGQGVGWIVEAITGAQVSDQVAVEQLELFKSQTVLYYCMAAFIVLVVPIAEELVFRGLLQTWLRRHLGRWASIAIAAVLFALAHLAPSQGWSNFEIGSQLFVLSLFLGFLYEREESLWAPIGLHATFNLVAATALILT